MESMCANPCPCADPAELQPASLVPTDPSCCLSAERKAITLKQHSTLAVSCRCLSSLSFSFSTSADADVTLTVAQRRSQRTCPSPAAFLDLAPSCHVLVAGERKCHFFWRCAVFQDNVSDFPAPIGDLLMQVHMQLCSCRLLTSLRRKKLTVAPWW